MPNSKSSALVGLFAIFLAVEAAACPGGTVSEETRAFNPCKDNDDFALPMPGPIAMTFRQVTVPGKDFWGDAKRIVKLGDTSGGIFQGERKVMVGGSFIEPQDSDWYYYLGKYEVTKAQFAYVMGDGDLKMGIQRLGELSGDPEDKKLAQLPETEQKQKLALPVAWIGWMGIQEFINKYNLWCLRDQKCQQALPVIKADNDKEGMKGFFRLPTEIEWEYAARGGVNVNEDVFKAELPFNRTDLEKHAVIKGTGAKILRIGTREPTEKNFYDLFGNVQELTGDMFQAEMGQGKSGALTARGGSIDTDKKEIRSAYRTEVPVYQLLSSGKISQSNASTGFRLALVGAVIPTSKYRSQIENAHQEYLKNLRDSTPAGKSILNPTVTAVGDLAQLSKELSTLLGKSTTSSDPKQLLDMVSELREGIHKTQAQLDDTSEKIDAANQKICEGYVKHTVFVSLLMVRTQKDIMTKTKLVDILSQKQNPNAQEQHNQAQLRLSVEQLGKQVEFYFQRYIEDMTNISECGERTAQKGIDNFKIRVNRGAYSEVEKESFNMFLIHFNEFKFSKIANPQWREDIFKSFQDKKLLMQL